LVPGAARVPGCHGGGLAGSNSWLEYRLIGVEDAYTDQRTLAAEKAKEVDEVKAAL
jgi:hypothetical protein